MRPLNIAVPGAFIFWGLLCVWLPMPAQELPSRTPVPTERAQAESLALVREVYKADFENAKTPAEKQVLAKKMLVKAGETKDDPTGRFMLLKLVTDVGVQASDVPTAFRAVDEMARDYDVDGLAIKVGLMVSLAGKARLPAQHKTVVEESLQLVALSISMDRFDQSEKLGATALAAAKLAGDAALSKQLRVRLDEAGQLAKAYEDVKAAGETLNSKPLDPEANLVVGKHLCLTKGNWDKGIPMLALGENVTLKDLATKELEGAKTPDDQVKLGDGWWSQAERGEGIAKEHLRARAIHWYKQALPGLSGLAKDKVESRLKEQPTWRLTKGGFPLVAGQWMEDVKTVSIVQREGAFTALCEYKADKVGLIRWRYDATITKDGKITGTLIHTQSPPSWKSQTRTAQLTLDGLTIAGKATWDSGAADFMWRSERMGK